MEKRHLGSQGLEVSAIGLGCMGMSWAYGKPDEKEVFKTLDRSLELGINFWDTAEIYGPFHNEELLGRAMKGRRNEVIVATKFAWEIAPDGSRTVLNGTRAHVKKTIEGSLKRLGTDHIDLYYQHRLDPKTPIEETVGAMAELVKEGKVRFLGLSEVGPGTIRRAHKVHPLSAIQSEYSLWERGVEEKVLPLLKELGIGFVPYSPVGRGFLTGNIKTLDDLSPDDWRRNNPRFQKENFERNMRLVSEVKSIASRSGHTASQVALAWLLHQGEMIVPIPGTTKVKHLEENAAAAGIRLQNDDWERIKAVLKSFHTAGNRYPDEMMKTIDRSE